MLLLKETGFQKRILQALYLQTWFLLEYKRLAPGPSVFKSHYLFLWLGKSWLRILAVQFSSVTQSCPTLCDPMSCSMPDFPVHHQLLEFTQTHVLWVGDAIQPSHLLSSPSPSAFNLSQNQGLFQRVSSLHQVAKVLELQHQSFQWKFRTDFL